jgi:hypothetical protein
MTLQEQEDARAKRFADARVAQYGTSDADEAKAIASTRSQTGYNEMTGTQFAKGDGTTPIPLTPANGFGSGATTAQLAESAYATSQKQPSQADIREQAAQRYQGEIDTLDDLFDSMVFDARKQGAERKTESLGQTRSINAQRGLLGSTRGFATRNKVSDLEQARTDEEVGLILAEKARQKSTIMTAIRDYSDGREEDAEKARTAGQAEYQAFLAEQESKNFDSANAVIAGLLQQGLNFDDLEQNEIMEVAKGLGLTVPQLESVYRGKLAEVEQGTSSGINDVLSKAIAAGADVETQQKIIEAATVRDALMAAGSFVPDEDPVDQTADIEEFRFAQSEDGGSYQGSFLDFQRANANLKAVNAPVTATVPGVTTGVEGTEGVPEGISTDSLAKAAAIMNPNSGAKLSDYGTTKGERAGVIEALNYLKDEATRKGDFVGFLQASAGGTNVDATTIQSLNKAMTVVGQIGDLKETITDENSGPLLGILRSANPYDEKAQLINAQLSAIVPNLARGVYGEVGVLTDKDVEIYSRTLPNIKQPEELRDLVLAMTLRTVQRGIENQLSINASGGRDVSGFVDTYNNLSVQIDRLLPQQDEEAEPVENDLYIVEQDGYRQVFIFNEEQGGYIAKTGKEPI